MTGRIARFGISLALAAAACVATFPARADLSSNCTSACHDASNQKFFNGAGAAAIITHANSNGMGAAFTPPATASTIAAEIQALMTSNYPNNQPIAFQTGATFDLPRIFHSTQWGGGATSSVTTVSAAGKGTVTYPAVPSSANYQATYTPGACQIGNDSFTYHASGAGGTTSTRTATVFIADPTTPPVISGSTPASGQTGVSYNPGGATSFNATCESASLITYSLVGNPLPPGLGLNASTGAITGTPTTVGNFTGIVVRATYNCSSCGALFDSSAAFAINITQGPPVITSGATAGNAAVGVAYSGYTIIATNSPTSYGGSGLPPGLSVVPGTGAVTGTPSDASGSPYVATLTAANGVLPNGSKLVTFNVAPAISSAASASGQTGVSFSYSITSGPGPAFTARAALDPLPPGLTLNSGTGIISGIPTAQGSTPVRLTGTTSAGATSAQFTLTINIGLGPPVITSPLTASGGATLPFSYQITATNPPHTAFAAAPLPTGVTVNPSTGLISGTPVPGSGGPYSVTISATNGTGSGNATLVLTISETAPAITSPTSASGVTGTPFSYQITVTNGASSYGANSLPPGLTLNTTSGLISGTPTTPGTFNASMSATNGSGTDTRPLVFTISLGAPVITSAASAGGAQGFPFSYQITATNSPTSFGATGLPPGLTVSSSTGLISGTPSVSGTFNATISATNATATASQSLAITLGVGVPVFTSAASASGGTGLPFLHQLAATNNPTSFGASGLPQGLAINAATGVISGTPAASGTFSVNASATNSSGTGTQALTITIALRPPTVPGGGGTVTGVTGVPFSYTVQPTGSATGFTATGLPPGLSINATTGTVSGTPTTGGTYNVTIGVTNSAGTTTLSLTIVIAFPLPTVAPASATVPFETATPITLPVTGESYTITVVTLPAHGLVSVSGNVATYTPATDYLGEDSFSYAATNPSGTTAAALVSINVTPVPPTARAARITVRLNTPASLNLAAFIKGSGLTGVAVRGEPAHGSVAVNGLVVTYTPRTDYFGADSFTYVAFSSVGASSIAIVTVQVEGRPDPTQDRDVVGLVDAQNQAARRFAGAQIGNIQRRMEATHRSEPVPEAPAPAPTPAPAARAEPVRVADASGAQRETARDVGPLSLATTLAQAVTSHSLALDSTSAPLAGGTALWITGNAQFGNVDERGDRSGARFGTDGVTLGADRRFGERTTLGVAAGFARDDSKIGSSGTRNRTRGASIAGYGSFQAGPRTFIDALLGYGKLDFASDRHVTAVDDFAHAERNGHQFFGSIAAGYEWRRDNLLLSPYGRIDFSHDRLDAVAESGVGSYALAYATQDQRVTQGALGVRAESRHETEFGFAQPRARIEYRREFGGERHASLSYADLVGGPEYTLSTTGTSRNALLLGVGADLIFRGGLRLGFDYTGQRASGQSNVQGVRIMVTQELDAPGAFAHLEPLLFHYPINVDFSYSYDDNVNRAREPGEKRWDNIFGMSANVSRNFALGTNLRVQATALASGEKFDRHNGLGRFSGGGQAELQYRASGAFDATTYSLVGRALYEQYESYYRTGPRYFVGFNARRALTDRIELFGELGANVRRGNSEVFNWKDYAAKLNLDYALGRKGTLYLAGEYRRGDTVSTGRPSLANVGVAEVFVVDDAYEGLGFLSYRFDASTVIGTLGLNWPLGARDSIDLSWRYVQATPRKSPTFDFSGPKSYTDNQYSLVYLMRF